MDFPPQKESIKKHGKILTDFANAETTDKACLAYFERIQDYFCLSPTFAKKIERVFPFKNYFIEGLSDAEKKLLNLIREETKTKERVANSLLVLDYLLKGYNPKTKTFVFF